MIRERYFIVGDGPLAERFYELLLQGGDPLGALEHLGEGFRDRACVDGIAFIYKPNIVEVRGHLVLYVPEYRGAERDVFRPPKYLLEIEKWGVMRLAQEGFIDPAAFSKEIARQVNRQLSQQPSFA